jgi:hypothetical protein
MAWYLVKHVCFWAIRQIYVYTLTVSEDVWTKYVGRVFFVNLSLGLINFNYRDTQKKKFTYFVWNCINSSFNNMGIAIKSQKSENWVPMMFLKLKFC